MGNSSPERSTRRSFLVSGGSALVAVAAAMHASPSLLGIASAQSGSLTEAQAATYEALVRAAGQAPGTLVRSSEASQGRERFARDFYASVDDEAKRHISAVLEALEAKPSDTRFSARSAKANHQLLRDLAASRTSEERELERRASTFGQGHPALDEGRAGFEQWLKERSRIIETYQQLLREKHATDPASLDPGAGLPRYTDGRPPAPPPFPDATGTEAASRRTLAGAALELAAIPFYVDRADPPL